MEVEIMSRHVARVRSGNRKAPRWPEPPDDGGWRQTFMLLFAIVVLAGAVALGSSAKTVSYWEARADVPASIGQAPIDQAAAARRAAEPAGRPEAGPAATSNGVPPVQSRAGASPRPSGAPGPSSLRRD
jgi:hypothetical protein